MIKAPFLGSSPPPGRSGSGSPAPGAFGPVGIQAPGRSLVSGFWGGFRVQGLGLLAGLGALGFRV